MRIEAGKACPPFRGLPSSSAATSSSSGAASSQLYHSDNIPHATADEAINSDDEMGDSFVDQATQAAREQQFEEHLAKRGLELKRMAQDGNCLFRCVADRVYGDAEMHDVVRRLCMEHMEKERDHFSQYLTQDFDAYVARKRRDRTFGNHLEIQAISEIYNRPVHVFDGHGEAAEPMNTFAAETEGDPGAPLRLSYHGRSHYNVLVDPSHADVGEGLGLPGFQPGLADKLQVEQARDASEASALEAQLISEAARSSEMEMTQDAILQAALRASLEDMTGGTSAGPACGGGPADGESEDFWSVAKKARADVGAFMPAAAREARDAAGIGEPTHAPHAASSDLASRASAGAVGGGEAAPVVSEAVQTLIAMGFSLARAVQAHAQFGDDVDSALAYLLDQ